jgi:hypothetical protein
LGPLRVDPALSFGGDAAGLGEQIGGPGLFDEAVLGVVEGLAGGGGRELEALASARA